MIKKKYIVAGNYEQYRTFLHKHRDDINVIYLYVDNIKTLTGLPNIEGYYVGTYYNRPDILDIRNMIKISKLDKTVYPVNNEYTVEHITALDNNHVIAYKYHMIVD
jgi:hypothetical protein